MVEEELWELHNYYYYIPIRILGFQPSHNLIGSGFHYRVQMDAHQLGDLSQIVNLRICRDPAMASSQGRDTPTSE